MIRDKLSNRNDDKTWEEIAPLYSQYYKLNILEPNRIVFRSINENHRSRCTLFICKALALILKISEIFGLMIHINMVGLHALVMMLAFSSICHQSSSRPSSASSSSALAAGASPNFRPFYRKLSRLNDQQIRHLIKKDVDLFDRDDRDYKGLMF
uniref:Uncharacterized protein n=1 Tax=Romanomermis culicivorax TaxID=13658 RepID=A0A915JF93_ROMCU